MTRREDRGTYQMLWDCAYCDTTKLLALDHRHCPGCGGPQDPDRRYFPSDDDKVAVEEHQYTGADWQCPACESPNAAGANFCVNCGAGQDDGETVARRSERAAAVGTAFTEDSVKQAEQEARAHRKAQRQARLDEHEARRAAAGGRSFKGAPGKKKSKVLLVLGVVVVAILILIFWKKTAFVTVSAQTWTRSIEIERFQAMPGEAWCDEMPGGAYRVARRREKRGTRQVEDGETCEIVQQDQGDGTFKEIEECRPRYREEDVYDQYCSFSIDRWAPVRTEEAAGASAADAPRWPVPTLQQTGQRLGAEREGARQERYIVTFRDEEGEAHDCAFSEAKWRSFSLEQRLEVKVGGLTGNLRCGSL